VPANLALLKGKLPPAQYASDMPQVGGCACPSSASATAGLLPARRLRLPIQPG
jgi:hypothetical protein